MNEIHAITPREIVGRDTILRFNMQFQAAAYAALEILKGKEVDRIYCDYHDDFVVRRVSGKRVDYHFFQVKTNGKRNHQWKLGEIFSLKKSGQACDPESLKNIRNSFAGKLFHHCIVFGESCREVSILTNIHFSDDVEAVVKELQGDKPTSKHTKFFVERFGEIFEIPSLDSDGTTKIVGKLSLLPAVAYIGDELEDFASAARNAIFKYSEIDLEHHETIEIAAGLVSLVNRKSYAKLEHITPEKLDNITGIGLEDLLGVLSISTEAYRALLAGDDPHVLKTASVIQRRLKAAGASDSMIEFCSQQKVNWDIWLRSARHTYMEFDLQFLLEHIDAACSKWLNSGGELLGLDRIIHELSEDAKIKQFSTLSKELIFGGVNAAIVRRATR